MKILHIDENYESYLNCFYTKNDISSLSYNDHLELLYKDSFSTNGAWLEPLSRSGFELTEIFYNNISLQNHWRREHTPEKKKNNFVNRFDLVFEQINFYKPDILYISNPHIFNSKILNFLKNRFAFIKLYICYLGTPYTKELISQYDICLTTIKQYSDKICKEGKLAAKMPHAFNSSISVIKSSSFYNYKLLFSGGIVRNSDMHLSRLNYLEYLSKNIEIDIYSDLQEVNLLRDLTENLKKKSAYLLIKFLKKLNIPDNKLAQLPKIGKAVKWEKQIFHLLNRQFRTCVKRPLYGYEMFQNFSENKIVFNKHVDNIGSEVGNMRLFEATGVGSCLLTEYKPGINDFFVPDKEVVCYTSKEECLEKAKYLLNNPNECKKIGMAGQRRTLNDHTYFNRVEIFNSVIKQALK